MCKTLEKSKYILNLQDNWDDEGSKRYKLSTWKRMAKFFANCNERAFNFQSSLDSPIISHSINGSIDVFWKDKNYKLLVNIPEDLNEKATFYGRGNKGNEIRGEFNPENHNNGLVMFLLNNQYL